MQDGIRHARRRRIEQCHTSDGQCSDCVEAFRASLTDWGSSLATSLLLLNVVIYIIRLSGEQDGIRITLRFSRANLRAVPQEVRPHLCQHCVPALRRGACGFGRGVWGVSKVTASDVWPLVSGKGFVICCSHYCTLFVVMGIIIEDTATFTLDMLAVVETVSQFLVTMLPAQKLQQGLQELRFDAIGRSIPQAQLEKGRTVTVRLRRLHLAAGTLEGQACDDKSAPDVTAEWLSEADDAQHYSGASGLEPDEVDFHGHEARPSESIDVASDCRQPEHLGQGVLEVIGAHVMEKRRQMTLLREGPFFDKQMSLLVTEAGDVIFVLWVNSSERQARQVSVDGLGRMVVVVPDVNPVQVYANADIVTLDIGMSMHRFRFERWHRPDMLRWCLDVLVHLNFQKFQILVQSRSCVAGGRLASAVTIASHKW